MTTETPVKKTAELQPKMTDVKTEWSQKFEKMIYKTPVHIYVLVGYYVLLQIAAASLLVMLILHDVQTVSLLRMLGFITSGAIIGSVLYQIRMLFRSYIKYENYDARWLGKYISAPWEAVALAAVVFSIYQGSGVMLGGSANISMQNANGFAGFGMGALVGFGMREVIGWLGNLAKTMFTTENHGKE